MGGLYAPPISRLIRALRDRLDYKVLVETGTFTGTSTAWAVREFDWVVSFDKSREHYATAKRRAPGAMIVTADSRHKMPALIDALEMANKKAIFWLDAHDDFDCPLLEELDAIMAPSLRHAVLIDDAHDFDVPKTKVYPPIVEILSQVKPNYIHGIAHDVIAILPEEAGAELEIFLLS